MHIYIAHGLWPAGAYMGSENSRAGCGGFDGRAIVGATCHLHYTIIFRTILLLVILKLLPAAPIIACISTIGGSTGLFEKKSDNRIIKK